MAYFNGNTHFNGNTYSNGNTYFNDNTYFNNTYFNNNTYFGDNTYFPPTYSHLEFSQIPPTEDPNVQNLVPENHNFIPSFTQAGRDLPEAPVQPPFNQNLPKVSVPRDWEFLLDAQRLQRLLDSLDPSRVELALAKAIAAVEAEEASVASPPRSPPNGSTDEPSRINVPRECQRRTGPVRNTPVRSRPIPPRAKAEAGPSTRRIPPVGQPTAPPSERAADAAITQPTAEGNKAPKKKRTRVPRGEGQERENRTRVKRYSAKIVTWAQKYKDLDYIPEFSEALDYAVDAIKVVREEVYTEPRLCTMRVGGAETSTKGATRERGRRGIQRDLYKELSQRYQLQTGPFWTQPKLLENVLKDLETHPALQKTP